MNRLGPLLCPILVGRDELLEMADRRLAEVAAGRGQFLLLAGEAGIGKTRFLGAIRRKAESRGFQASDGAVSPPDRDVPASIFLDMARNMTRQPVFEGLGRDLLQLREDAATAEHVRRRMLVLDIVDRITGAMDEPMLLAFEDLQWVDDLSLEIIAELARRAKDRAILLVGSYRSDELSPDSHLRDWRSRLLTQRLAEEARLTPLTLEQTGLMTTLILDTGLPAPREVVTAVYERTDGIPLHIEELLGVIGDAARSDGQAIREASVPDTIEDAIRERIRRRSVEAQAVARAGAIIGRCFVPDVLAGIMDVPPDRLDAPLQELVDHDFLDPPGRRGLYDFRHQLLRDVLYETVPPRDRRRFHARAGEFGAQLEGASEIHASVHFERAGMRAEAFNAAVAGARTAARLSSHREAFELYRRALANAPQDLDAAEHAGLLEAFSDEAGANDENDLAERFAAEARDRFLAAGRPIDAARVKASIAWYWRRAGRPVADRVAMLQAALVQLDEIAPGAEHEEVRQLLVSALAYMQLDDMALADARTNAIETLAAAGAAANGATIADARAVIGAVAAIMGDVDGGLDEMGAATRAARDHGFAENALKEYRDVAAMAARVMAYPRSEAWLREGIAYADTIDQSHCRYNMSATLALVAWADGRWDESIAVASQVLADRRGGVAAETTARAALGYVAFGRGELERARAFLDESLAAGAPSGEVARTMPAMWGLAETELATGDRSAAERWCEDAYETARRTGERSLLVPFLVTGARALLAAGRPDDAARWVDRVSEFVSSHPAVAAPAIDHGRGLVRLASGATGVAREAFEAAVRGWDERHRTWEATWARLDLVACDLRSNRFAEAASILADARETASRLESWPLLRRADELAQVGRGRGSLDEPWRPLTSREFEVARLIAGGLTNGEIAGELSIAPKTASAHVEHILAKLGVTRRAEIATWVATVTPPTAAAGDMRPEHALAGRR
jgi:DNA-binding CsgD family transcriptional regulator/tetratricopeptide (TPR) repeat protein